MERRESEIARWLAGASELTAIAHVSPDGDTIGSCLALYHALGERVQLVCEDPVPPRYAFLPGAAAFLPPAKARQTACAAAIDCADMGRMGGAASLFAGAEHTALIDHHGTNPGYAQVSRVEPGLGATGTLVWEILAEMGAEISPDAAQCLYAAISTDTGNFCFSSTTRRDMAAAAELVERFNLDETTRRLYRLKRRAHMRLLGEVLGHMEFFENGRIVAGAVTRAQLEACGAEFCDTDEIINHMASIEGVEAAIFASERGGAKISLRTASANAAAIAQRFGGGGHARAAGMTIQAGLADAVRRVAEEVAGALR